MARSPTLHEHSCCLLFTHAQRFRPSIIMFHHILCQRGATAASFTQHHCLKLTIQASLLSSTPESQDHHNPSHNTHSDMVGPPDPVSNIRPFRLREPTSETVSTCTNLKAQAKIYYIHVLVFACKLKFKSFLI